jgi:hypothetical protein
MKPKLFLATAALLFLIPNPLPAQKELLFEYDAVVARARAELDSMMAPGGMLQAEALKQGLKGEYIIDVTVAGKGQVLSVYMVSSDADDVKQGNLAKDLVRTARFGFKMPKDKTYKFQYTFVFR